MLDTSTSSRIFAPAGTFNRHLYKRCDVDVGRFRMKGAEFPNNMSQNAANIFAQKYFRKAGVPAHTVAVEVKGVPEWLWPHAPAPGTLFGSETSARQVYHRQAGTWTFEGWQRGYFGKDEAAARTFYEALMDTLQQQFWAPNSPQWFNTGLWWAYGIDGPSQGHWYAAHPSDPSAADDFSPADATDQDDVLVRPSNSAYRHPQPHACFIQSVEDDLVNEGGIMDLVLRESRLFKYGSGTGSNFSSIRSSMEKLSGGGMSSGLMSFLKVPDQAAGTVKSGGTTRRAAKMVIVDSDHPEIEAFVDWKAREERKVAYLVAGSKTAGEALKNVFEIAKGAGGSEPAKNPDLRKAMKAALRTGLPSAAVDAAIRFASQGEDEYPAEIYDASWEGEAYGTVSGQNANNSVRVPDALMQAVINDQPWQLTARTTGETVKNISALALWKRIARAAWQCADPGLQFHDSYNDWHTCPVDGPILGTNPCSEYAFLDDTACNLASINLIHFIAENGVFDDVAFRALCSLIMRVLDISVSMAQYPSKKIAIRSLQYRTTGLGYANLGGLLMVEGLSYGSEEGRQFAAAITALMHGEANLASSHMAKQLGTFPAYERNKNAMLDVMRAHSAAAHGQTLERNGRETIGLNPVPGSEAERIAKVARSVWTNVLQHGSAHGFRNAQTTVLAPTGTIGLVMDCDTTGIEPDYSLVKYKTLAGGGMMKIRNRLVERALRKLGYEQDKIDRILDYANGAGLAGAVGVENDWVYELAASVGNLAGLLAERGLGENHIAAAVDHAKRHGTLKGAEGISLKDASFLAAESWSIPAFLTGKGFSPVEAEAARLHAQGRGALEGCPDLKPEHLPVFDTAVAPAGFTRALTPESHVLMMAACQPFLSGSISKTVNMPRSATIADIANIHMLAWKTGVKAIAVYRDSSKLSQPLNLNIEEDQSEQEADEAPKSFTQEDLDKAVAEAYARGLAEGSSKKPVVLARGVKERLPGRVPSVRQRFTIAGHDFYTIWGFYPDGRPGEVFINTAKEGSAYKTLMSSLAITISTALQYGVPIEAFVDTFLNSRFEPAGTVQHHARIKMATSPLDAIFKDIAIEYLRRDDLANVKSVERSTDIGRGAGDYLSPAPAPAAVPPKATPAIANRDLAASAIGARRRTTLMANAVEAPPPGGFTGDICSKCESPYMRKAGTCLVCTQCGETTGCG